ncbi:MAG TPA: sn-glycerol-3-phosphate ABC transporter permease UgpA [Azospirillaceae bacterium]|nr:sn-glycerol-3-phosphate ABC transporter permease UgpA [Azospirillaceae bacterium]
MNRRVIFDQKLLPYLLLFPQVAVTLVFFIWPAAQAIWQSTQLQDAFGLSTVFVWFENYEIVLADPDYFNSARTTVVFALSVTGLSMTLALLFAAMADAQIKGKTAYQALLIWPYAVAPAVSALLWVFIFHPNIGIVGRKLNDIGLHWDYKLVDGQALLLVILAAAWKQVSYNFIFFLAALQSIPKSVIEASAIDGAGPVRRFATIVFPLITPTTFFLLVVNLVYSFFETFGVIHALTKGGPGTATSTLIYKVYVEGAVNHNLGASAAQSVILMIAVIALTVVQFRFIERKVHYG